MVSFGLKVVAFQTVIYLASAIHISPYISTGDRAD